MKIRVRLRNTTKTVDFGDKNSKDVTYSLLRQCVKSEFLLESDFDLSLNKRDVLEGENKSLSEFGIVGGDLVHILTQDDQEAPLPSSSSTRTVSLNQPEAKWTVQGEVIGESLECSPSCSHPEQDGHRQGGVAGTSAREMEQDMETQPEDGAGAGALMPAVNDPGVNRYLLEPLLCCESVPDAVPAQLSLVYSATPCESKPDRLWLVIHVLMLEAGFKPVQGDNGTGGSMPDNWRRPSLYVVKYGLADGGELTCTLTGVSMGNSVVISGSVGGTSDYCTSPLKIRPEEFVTSTTESGAARNYQKLGQLSRCVKNQICLPLMQEMRTLLGFPSAVGLISLTHEVKLKILGYLDCVSLLNIDQTCQHFHCLARDTAVWRRRYLQDFGGRTDNSLAQNWYELYKRQYIIRVEHRKAMRQMTYITPGPLWGQPRPNNPFAPVIPNHGILGGDYDLNPQFHGIPNPFGLGQPGQHPLQPGLPCPRFDPFGPVPDPSFNPGRGGGRRDNRGHRRGGGWMGGFGGPRMF